MPSQPVELEAVKSGGLAERGTAVGRRTMHIALTVGGTQQG